jgi:hypothetical protein
MPLIYAIRNQSKRGSVAIGVSHYPFAFHIVRVWKKTQGRLLTFLHRNEKPRFTLRSALLLIDENRRLEM